MWLVYILIGVIVGVLIGVVIGAFTCSAHKIVGDLIMDISDPEEGPYMFVEFYDNPKFKEGDIVCFKAKTHK